MRRPSVPSFVAGVVATMVLAAVPATAVLRSVSAEDANPNTFDGTSPTLTAQPIRFVTGASIDAAPDPETTPCLWYNAVIPLEVRWSGTDGVSGMDGLYDVWGEPSWDYASEFLHQTSATSWRVTGGNNSSDCGGGSSDHAYWVVGRDNRGNSATAKLGSQYVDVWQETGFNKDSNTAVRLSTRTGTWSTSNCTCFNGGHTLFSTAAGAALTYTVTTTKPGRTVALVTEKNTNRGVANVSIDGAAPTSFDTHASTPTHRVIVFQKLLSVGTHTVKISNAGTAGRSRIDVDSILLTNGRVY